MLERFSEKSKNPRAVRLHRVGVVATAVAKDLVESKAKMLLRGEGNKDVFSLLSRCAASFRPDKSDRIPVKANMDVDAKAKLTEEELIAQMRWVHNMFNRTSH